MPEDFEANIKERKLLTIYHFVRGLPLLYVVTRLRKELEDIKAKEKQMEEKLQEFKQRKESILRKLGQKVENCWGATWQRAHEMKTYIVCLQ